MPKKPKSNVFSSLSGQKNKENDPREHFVSVQAVLNHLDFLKEVDSLPGQPLYKEEVVQNAVRRYKQCWLPLMDHIESRELQQVDKVAPPLGKTLNFVSCLNQSCFITLDVHWAWHCHMLCPTTYWSDLLSRPTGPLDHSNRSKEDWDAMRQACRTHWERLYPEEPFDPPWITGQDVLSQKVEFNSGFEYDIVAASQRQKSFYYQVR